MNKYEKFLSDKNSEIRLLSEKAEELAVKISSVDILMKNLTEIREILSIVGILAYKEIKVIIEELVTQSLQSVFGDNYSFELENKISRNKPETYMYVVIDGNRRSLKDEQGGGVADLVAFSLRVILWALSGKHTDNVMILDEPLRFVDKAHLTICGEMIKSLSNLLGIQFILVTHESQLFEQADKSFLVEQVNGVSTVQEV